MTLVLEASEVERLFDLDTARICQAAAFRSLERGEARQEPKLVSGPTAQGVTTVTFVGNSAPDDGTVVKVVTIAPENASRHLPTIHALVAAFDPLTGELVAILDGTTVTTLRTAAGSAVAADRLAHADARRMAILGAGVQGLAHARAISRVRPVDRIVVWSRTPAHRDAAVLQLRQELALDVEPADSAEAAAASADIVACCTAEEAEPVLMGAWLEAGTFVITVGSTLLRRPEVDEDTIRRSWVVVDDPTHAFDGHPYTTLGSVLDDPDFPTSATQDVTLYVSGGLPVQDAAAAWTIVRRLQQATGTPGP